MLKSVFDTAALLLDNFDNAAEILKDQDNLPLQPGTRIVINEAANFNVLDKYKITK